MCPLTPVIADLSLIAPLWIILLSFQNPKRIKLRLMRHIKASIDEWKRETSESIQRCH